jgi:hypothetical protein
MLALLTEALAQEAAATAVDPAAASESLQGLWYALGGGGGLTFVTVVGAIIKYRVPLGRILAGDAEPAKEATVDEQSEPGCSQHVEEQVAGLVTKVDALQATVERSAAFLLKEDPETGARLLDPRQTRKTQIELGHKLDALRELFTEVKSAVRDNTRAVDALHQEIRNERRS